MRTSSVFHSAADSQYILPNVYLTAIITIMCACDILAFKIISIFGFQIALSGFLFPSAFLLLNAFSESYGYKMTEKVILMSLVAQIVFLSLMLLAIQLPSTINTKTSSLYAQLFHNFWRVFLSGIFGVVLSFLFSIFFNAHLKIWLLGANKISRFILSTGSAKAILVAISYPINFYGILSIKQILIICLNTWIFKVLMGSLMSLLSVPLVKLNRRIDKIDVYDFNTNYNPLKLYEAKNSGMNFYGKKPYKNRTIN